MRQGYKTKIDNYGLFDVFFQSGSIEDLNKFYRLDSLSIKKYVKKVINKNENS